MTPHDDAGTAGNGSTPHSANGAIPHTGRASSLVADLDPGEHTPPRTGESGAPIARTLDDVLPLLEQERAPGDVGGVPLPAEWRCFRAAIGGASRDDLEAAHGEQFGRGDVNREAEQALGAHAADGAYLPPGLHIVTGQTGGGKSAFVMNLARAAIGAGNPVLYVSLELDAEELAARLLGLDAELPWGALSLRRRLSDDQRRRRGEGIAALRDRARRFVALVPDGALPLEVIRTTAHALWREHGRPPLVVFDYLQAASIQAPGDKRPLQLREHIAAVSLELRRLSMKGGRNPAEWQGCPVVVLSLTARGNVTGESKVPGMDGKTPDKLRHADLETLKALPKEAGEVEATAVTAWVMALGEAEADGLRPVAMRLVKTRFGRAGQWLPFQFHGATGTLTEQPERYKTTPAAEQKPGATPNSAEELLGRGGRS